MSASKSSAKDPRTISKGFDSRDYCVGISVVVLFRFVI